MYHNSDSLKNYSIKLIEHALNESHLGLSGKLGIAIYLFEYGRWSVQDGFLTIGEQLVLETLRKASLETLGFNYRDGILGIGVGIAYLYERGFIEGCPDEILSDIDQLVRRTIGLRAINSEEFNTNMIGILFYLYLRTKERCDLSISLLSNREHLIYAIDWLESLYTANKISDDRIYTILCLLHSSKIYPTKTDSLLAKELNRLEHTPNPKFYSDIELLEISPLSALQPWIRLKS